MLTRTIRLTLGALAAIALAGSAGAHEFKVGSLEIGHPYSRAMLPGAPVGGGFLTVTNSGTEPDRLIRVTSPAAGRVELHQMSMQNDVMTMRELPDGIEIPAGATVELKPGGLHLMFMDVSKPFAEKDDIKATLEFEKAGTVDVDFVVGPAGGKPADPAAGAHDAHGAHSGHGG